MGRRRKDPGSRRAISRRGFLTTVSTAPIAGAAIGRAHETPAPVPAAEAHEPVNVVLKINGRSFKLQVEPRDTLLTALREKLGMTGTKPGCERGECGVCTVLVDDKPAYSCMILAVEAEGKTIVTLEGLMRGEELGVVQRAFVEQDAFQCGYCTPGQIMAAEGLLRANPNPSLDEIRLGMSGNLCRCGSYDHIFKAVRRAATSRQAGGVK